MAGDRSFGNVIITRNVTLAIEQILIAPSSQTWTPTKLASLANTSLPTGFRHLGAVVEDSVTLTISREKFTLLTGLPKVLQYSAVTGVSGRMEAQFHSYSNRTMTYANASVDAVNFVATIFPLWTTTSQFNTALVITTNWGTQYVVGDVLLTSTTTPTILSTDNEAEVNSVGVLAGANSVNIYFTSPGFPDTPNTSWFVAKLTGVVVPAGTSKQKEYHIVGVSDSIDGYQLIHDMQKARGAAGDMQDAMRPTENGKVQARWELYGYATSRYLPDTELIVMERFWFPKG